MDLIYGAAHDIKLPTPANWLGTSARTGRWHGPYVRSALLQQLDTALNNFNLAPTAANFTALRNRNQAWRVSKRNLWGNVTTRRAAQATPLNTQIDAYQTFLGDRQTLIGRVNALINGVALAGGRSWKQLYLAAELYDVQDGDQPPWHLIGDRNVKALEFEARAGSGWAMMTPVNVPDWAGRGATEVTNAQNWPAAPFAVRMRLGQIGLTAATWPPWTNPASGALQLPFLRRGLYCHTSAALAAHFLHANRLVLEAGLTCRIRTISVVHQQPAQGGGMSHWWVCVNKPDRIDFGNRQHHFNNFNAFGVLPMCGGFVVDMWGALWNDQNPAPPVPPPLVPTPPIAPQRAASDLATAGDCVDDVPGNYLGNTATVVRANNQYF